MLPRSLNWLHVLGAIVCNSKAWWALLGFMGASDTICSMAAMSETWCGSKAMTSAIFSEDIWLPLSIIIGVALILLGERKRYSQIVAATNEKMAEFERDLQNATRHFEAVRKDFNAASGDVRQLTETSRSLDLRLHNFKKDMVHTYEREMGSSLTKAREATTKIESLERLMAEQQDRFDRLLEAMAKGDAPSAGKTASTPQASSQDGHGGYDETQTHPDTSTGA